ncbi:hypothetical protein IP88_11365 [alpha proteobacterium AAP81b]|nr:hypothetical protein IP88_11365 [alpha proteobacterium AAP81b]
MAKAAIRREAIIERVADFLLAEGLGAASLRPLAKAAGTSDRMLLYYFPDKDALIAAALEHAAGRLAARLAAIPETPRPAAQLEAEMLALTGGPEVWPFMCLAFEVTALAARGNAFYRATGGALAAGFLAWIAARLDVPDAERGRTALAILRTVDGALYLRGTGLDDAAIA